MADKKKGAKKAASKSLSKISAKSAGQVKGGMMKQDPLGKK